MRPREKAIHFNSNFFIAMVKRFAFRCNLLEENATTVVVCICKKGFEFIRENGVGKCVDIDECKRTEENDLCYPNSRCVNEKGSFHCECVDGNRRY